jgi:hypothetical protein
MLFNKIRKGDFKIIYSRLTDIELNPAPEKVRNLAKKLPKKYIEFIDVSDEALKLADHYIKEKVVVKRAYRTVYISHLRHFTMQTCWLVGILNIL